MASPFAEPMLLYRGQRPVFIVPIVAAAVWHWGRSTSEQGLAQLGL